MSTRTTAERRTNDFHHAASRLKKAKIGVLNSQELKVEENIGRYVDNKLEFKTKPNKTSIKEKKQEDSLKNRLEEV